MARLAVALLVVTTSAAAQERTSRELYAEAQRLHEQGEVEQAVDAFAEAARLAAEDGEGPEKRGAFEGALALALCAAGRTEEAEAHMRQAVELVSGAVPVLDRTLASYRIMLAAIEGENGKFDEAEFDACTALEAAQGTTVEAQCLMTLARVSFERRQYRVADALLRLAAARALEARLPRQDSIDIWRVFAILCMEIGAYDLAEKTLEDLRVDHEAGGPTPAAALDWARLLAELRIKQRRLAEAEQVANDALERAAGAPNVRTEVAAVMVSLARIALEKVELERAGKQLEQAETALRRPGPDSRPHLASLLETRAQLRRRLRNAAGARTDLEEALVLRSRHGENGLGAARTLLALAELESAEGAHAKATDYAVRSMRIYLRELGAKAPEVSDSREKFERVRARAVQGGLTEADLPILKGVRVNEALEADAAATDAKVRALFERATALEGKQDPAGALALLDEALALRLGEPTLHSGRATILAQMKRSQDVVAALDEQILWSLSTVPDAYAWRAGHQLRLRNHDRVIVDATYALLLGGDDVALRKIRGISRLGRLENDELELGLRDFDACLKADPQDAGIQYLRGLALWHLERLDEAAAAYRAAVAGGSKVSMACAKLAVYERRRGNEDEALVLATQSIDAGAADLDAYGVRGFIRFDRCEWKAALADFEAWAGTEPPSLYGRILQWVCRARMGDRAAATDALRAAIEGEKEREDLKCVARAILGEPAAAETAHASGCAAQFLLGAWQEIVGEPAQAKVHYERSVAKDRPDLLEHQSAKAALARLGGGK